MSRDPGPPPEWREILEDLGHLLSSWQTPAGGIELPPTELPRAARVRAAGILHGAMCLVGEDPAVALRNAIDRGDPAAVQALDPIRGVLRRAAGHLVRASAAMRRDHAWKVMLNPSGLALEIATAADLTPERGRAAMLFAQARRGSGDTPGAIEVYRFLIDNAVEDDEEFLPIAHGNTAEALVDLGELDEAYEHFIKAIELEKDPLGRRRIELNLGRLWTELGELRQAAETLEAAIAGLEEAGVEPRELALALDTGAQAFRDLGELDTALEMLDRARSLFPADDYEGRAIHASIRNSVFAAAGDPEGQAAAFREAHDLALRRARWMLDPDGSGRARAHYRHGFEAARAHRLPPDHPATLAFLRGMAARDRGDMHEAIEAWHRVTEAASAAGDLALVLQADAHRAALHLETGDIQWALDTARQARHEALHRGLARTELHALVTLSNLSELGVDVAGPLGPLGLLTEAWALVELHEQLVADLGLDQTDPERTIPTGALSANLAVQAERNEDYSLAMDYYRRSLEVALETPRSAQLANRLSGLCRALDRLGERDEAEEVAGELERLLERRGISDRTRTLAHRALGFHLLEAPGSDRRPDVIAHFERVAELLERQRDRLDAGLDRAEVTRLGEETSRELARLLREAGDASASFEALQLGKGRDLIDHLAESGEGKTSDAPATAREVGKLVVRLGRDRATTAVDLLFEHGSLTAYLVDGDGVEVIRVEGDTRELDRLERGDVREREMRLIRHCLDDPLLAELATRITAATPEEGRLLILPDGLLGNLPLHMVPVDGASWGERRAISYHVAAGALRFAPGRRGPTGRSLVAGDSADDLEFAREECLAVARTLGTDAVLGGACSLRNLADIIDEGDLDIVHLAVHGRGDVERGRRSSLLLASDEGPKWVPIDELLDLSWHAELVVLSGCSTGVSGRRYGTALAGISRAASQAGAAAVVACLWPVDDEAAAVFMIAFYEELERRRSNGVVDLRDVMDHAREVTRAHAAGASANGARSAWSGRRDGRRSLELLSTPAGEWSDDVIEGLAWGPFMLLGDPILGG